MFSSVADSEKRVWQVWCFWWLMQSSPALGCAKSPLCLCSEGVALKQPAASVIIILNKLMHCFGALLTTCDVLFFREQDNAPHLNNGWNLSRWACGWGVWWKTSTIFLSVVAVHFTQFQRTPNCLANTLKIIAEHSGAPSTWQWYPVAFQTLQFDVSSGRRSSILRSSSCAN